MPHPRPAVSPGGPYRRSSRASLALALIIVACAAAHLYFFRTEPERPGFARRIAMSRPPSSCPRSATASGPRSPSASSSPGIRASPPGLSLAWPPWPAWPSLPSGRGRGARRRALLGVAFGGLLFGALLRTRYSLGEYFEPLGNGRYVYLPQLIALWLLLLAAADRGRTGRVAAVLLVLALAVNIPRLREPAYADLHWERYAPLIRAGRARRHPDQSSGMVHAAPSPAAVGGPSGSGLAPDGRAHGLRFWEGGRRSSRTRRSGRRRARTRGSARRTTE